MDYIKFSMSRQSQDERSCGFARIVGFLMVQGAIDCTHVALRALPHTGEVFRNRKGYHFLNVQLACDHRQMILAVNARYPGSCHDAFILRDSSVPRQFQPPHEGRAWLIGDKGYGVAPWLMTPLHNPTNPAEQRYNISYIATRTIVEQTIMVLKQHFCCLNRSGGAFQYSPDRVSIFTVVCCMLHNLTIMRGSAGIHDSPQEDDDDEEEDEQFQPRRRQFAAARAAHQRLVVHRFQ
uniref:putative nuclease HARBI1 n=1 Tax=Pristiophorus japonicus TaxID=55135 RepID=UPI00398E79DC